MYFYVYVVMEDECEEGGNRFGGVEDLSKLS